MFLETAKLMEIPEAEAERIMDELLPKTQMQKKTEEILETLSDSLLSNESKSLMDSFGKI